MPRSIPIATYRLQLTSSFTFDDAAELVPYLKILGISHLYASPFMKARKGSTHGYDIVDHNTLNPELGGEEAFARLIRALKDHDLGLILDFVPNHMGVHFGDNAWWLDVLEWGKASPYASFFDIEWETLPYRTKGGVLLPILGTSYGEALDSGEIELRFDRDDGSFSAWYFEHRLPIALERYSEILRVVVTEAGADETAAGRVLLALASQYKGLGRPSRLQAPDLKAALRDGVAFHAIIAKGLRAYRANGEQPSSAVALHSLLERQHYRLAHWRLATSEINYRRFFDVNSLAGLRVEEASTFDAIHGLVRRLVAEDWLQGLRLDHIDGLRDPAQYCQRLASLIAKARGRSRDPFYVVVEKILGPGEALPRLTGVQGTTGYEWLNVISQVLLDLDGLETLDEVWRQASNQSPKLAPVLEESKRRVLETLLASEFTVLARMLARIAIGHYSTRDFSADSLRQALELYVLHFPVYRTYMTAAGPSAADRNLISSTIEKARMHWFGADEGIFDFLRDTLTMDLAKSHAAPGRPRIRRFALRVQQFTGPMMAKSLEDTAFYRFHRLAALNEVGGDPVAHAMSRETFHELMRKRAKSSPHGMTATATHDTKRGEDARMRLLSLSELATAWAGTVGQWKELNAPHVAFRDDVRSPSIAFEYLLYQTLIGAWCETPDAQLTERIKAYAIKAAREAKLETSWLNPNPFYEDGLTRFVDRILDPAISTPFLESLASFARRVSLLGALNSLSQITLKTMMPGVPDFYQGTEFWDTSLVDPDNRRPVDFHSRQSVVANPRPDWTQLVESWQDGRLKMAWTRRLLDIRNSAAMVFSDGSYDPVAVSGPDDRHVIAFARRFKTDAVIVAVGRRMAKLTDEGRIWPRAAFNAALDVSAYTLEPSIGGVENGRLPVERIFTHFPACILKAKVRRRGVFGTEAAP